MNDSPTTLSPRETPPPATLIDWVRGDIADMASLGVFAKLQRCQITRDCWWAGRNAAGETPDQPYGTRASNPWPGALDHAVRVVDGQCNLEVDLAKFAWYRSQKTVLPRNIGNAEETEKAQAWRHGVDYFLDMTSDQMDRALELFANTRAEFGQAVWYEGWRDQWQRNGRKKVSWQELLNAGVQNQIAQEFPPEGPQPTVEQQGQISDGIDAYLELLRQDPTQNGAFREVLSAYDPLLVGKELTKVASAFRKGTDDRYFDAATRTATYFAPVLVGGRPIHKAFVPGIDCFYPVMAEDGETDHESVPRMTFVEQYTAARIDVESKQDNWDPEFTAALLAMGPGTSVDLASWGATGVAMGSWALNGMDAGMVTSNPQALKNAGLWQMMRQYFWGVAEDGLPAPFVALLHPMIDTSVAFVKCDPDGHGRMPWLLKTRTQKRRRAVSAQTVADEMGTNQLGRKKLTDAGVSQTELRSNPPRLTTMEGGGDGLRPGASLAVAARFLTGGPGGPRFMEVPDLSSGSMAMLQHLQEEEDSFYLKGEKADPDAKSIRRVVTLFKWCSTFKDILSLMCLNIQHHVDEVTIGSIGDQLIQFTLRNEDLQGDLSIKVKCDEASIDPDMAVEKMSAFMKFAAAADRNGTLDWDTITRWFVMLTFPDLAGSMGSPQAAQDRIKADQRNRIAQMVTNVPLKYDQMADAPDMRAEILNEWLQIPGTVQIIQNNQVLQQQVDREQQWLQFARDQQQENPTTGRTGVPPKMKPIPAGGMLPA